MAVISHEAVEVIEILGLSFEFIGAFILAKEVWDRPVEVSAKEAIKRVLHIGPVKVRGLPIKRDQDTEAVFAILSARKARLGFLFVAVGIGGKLVAKVLGVLPY